jgi:hypothetical protein
MGSMSLACVRKIAGTMSNQSKGVRMQAQGGNVNRMDGKGKVTAQEYLDLLREIAADMIGAVEGNVTAQERLDLLREIAADMAALVDLMRTSRWRNDDDAKTIAAFDLQEVEDADRRLMEIQQLEELFRREDTRNQP